MNRLAVGIVALLIATPALATGEIVDLVTDLDRQRLSNFSESRKEAAAEARAGGAPEDVKTMERIMSARHLSFDNFDMSGEWQCRTLKLGGLVPIVIYSWFRCEVSDDGSGWWLTKLNGSQRTSGGFFTDSDTRWTYLGSGSVNDERPLPYGSGPESDQAGFTFRTGRDTWHIEFPAPHYESKFDILEFRR